MKKSLLKSMLVFTISLLALASLAQVRRGPQDRACDPIPTKNGIAINPQVKVPPMTEAQRQAYFIKVKQHNNFTSPSGNNVVCNNLILDGGFETGGIPSSIWNPETSTNFGTPLCDVAGCGTGGGASPPRTGNIWAWFGGIGAPETATIGQTVTILPGTATLNFWMRNGTVNSPFTDVFRVRVDGTIVQTYTEAAVAEAAYTLRSVNLNAYANGAAHVVLFEYVGLTTGTCSFVVDDVTLDNCVASSGDLSITKTDGVTTYTPGGTTTYTITASNAGPNTMSGVTVTDNFPAAITSVAWTATYAGSATGPAAGAGNISATVNLPAGGSATFTAVCNISGAASGSLVNTATVATGAGDTDPNAGNNSATDTDSPPVIAGTPIGSNEVEANNTPATANAISGNQAKVRANIMPANDVDVFSFTAAAGDRVYAAVQTSYDASASGDAVMELIASDGTTVLETDNNDGTFNANSSSIAGTVIPAAGTYYIRVRHNLATATIRGYDLYLRVQSGSPTAEVESNNTPATANVLPVNGWVSGSINPAADADFYSMTLAAGETVFLSLDLNPERDAGVWNGRLGFALFGNAGNQILVANDGNTGATASDPNSEAFFFTVKTAGTYYVYVDHPSGLFDPTFTYHLSAVKFAAPAGPYTTFTSTNVPQTIPTGPGIITSTLTIPGSMRIKDLSVNLNLNHTFMQDLDVTLTSPNGNVVALFTDIGGATVGGPETLMDINLSDSNAIPPSFAITTAFKIQPEAASKLNQFLGMEAGGTWTLTIYDDATGDGGTLNSWSLEVLPDVAPNITGANVIANEDFEATDGGFTHSGTADEWARGLPSAAPITTANSGTNCWKTDLAGTYNANSDQTLSSATYAIPAGANPKWLSWAMKYQMESRNFDSLRIYVEEVGNPANSKTLFEWLGATQTAPVGNPSVTLNLSAGWGTHWADISSFSGLNIQFKVKLASDGTVQMCGAAIDDFKIYELITCTPSSITLGTNPVVCSGATSANLPYTATTGTPDQYSIDYDAAANTAGFVDVVNAALPASPIALVVPGAAPVATYNATITVRKAVGGCVSPAVPFTVTITAASSATISYAGTPYCSNAGTATVTRTGTAGGTYSAAPAGLTINAANGDVTLATSTAGTYTVTYTIAASGSCPVFTTTTSITVTAAPAATISYAGTPYCSNAGTANVTRTGTAGGTYSSTAGLTLNASTGAVTLGTSTPGTYTVTYTIAAGGGCGAFSTTTTITITAAPSATISYAGSPYCSTDLTAPVTRTGTAGGTYSSTAGLTINATTGTVTPNTSTPGTYTVTYTIAAGGGCGAFSTTTTITITQAPNAIIFYLNNPYCSNSGTAAVSRFGTAGGTYSAAPAGLTINATTGAVTLGTSTPGTYTVTYTIAASGGCGITITTTTITITPAPSATISYTGSPYCSNAGTATVTRTGTAGGTYSSTPGLTLNASTGAVTLGTSTPGTYVVTYTVAASGGCAVFTTTTSITITALPAATISYAGSPYCSNAGTATVTRTGTAGGTYSSTAGLVINASTGDVNLATSTAGTYTVTYTIAAGGGCPVVTTTTTITITTLPAATITYTGNPFCQNAGTATVTRTGTAGGTYSAAPAGLTINATTGTVTLGTSTPGTYTVTYTIAAGGGCGVVTATTSITVSSLSVAATAATASSTSLCGPTAITLSVTGGSLGTGATWRWYTGSCGGTLVGTGATLVITPTATTTYFVRAEGTCNTTTCVSVTVTVNIQPTIALTATLPTSLMPGQTSTLTATVTPANATNTTTWYRDGNVVPGATGLSLVVGVDALGLYTVRTTTTAGCTALSNAVLIKDSASGKMWLYPNPNSGQFQVRYYSNAQQLGFVRHIIMYNQAGQKVFDQTYPITGPYSNMNVDARILPSGVYVLQLTDAFRNEILATDRVVITR